jgi:hypothetical protein
MVFVTDHGINDATPQGNGERGVIPIRSGITPQLSVVHINKVRAFLGFRTLRKPQVTDSYGASLPGVTDFNGWDVGLGCDRSPFGAGGQD